MRVVELRTGLDSSVVIHLISRICQDVIDKSDRCFLTASVVCVLVSVQLNYSHSFSSFLLSFLTSRHQKQLRMKLIRIAALVALFFSGIAAAGLQELATAMPPCAV